MATELAKKTATKKTAKKTQNVAKKNAKKTQNVVEDPKKRKKMGTSSATFAKRIREALTTQERYTQELNMTIIMVADALHVWSRAKDEISKLDQTWTREESKYGYKLVEHPALKTHREYMREARHLLKALGLTIEDIVNKERDALTEFDEQISE